MKQPVSARMAAPRLLGSVRRLLVFWGLAAGLLAVTTAGPAAGGKIYRYVDDAGVTHFSDSPHAVPDRYRWQLRDVAAEVGNQTGFQVVPGLDGNQPDEEVEVDASGAALFGFDAASGDGAQALLGSLGGWVILILLLALPLLMAIGGMILKLACRLAGADPSPSLGRACVILFAQSIAGSVAGGLVNVVTAGATGDEPGMAAAFAIAVGSGLLSWVVGAAVLNGMTGYGMGRSLWVGVVHTGLVLVLIFGPIAAVAGVLWLVA